MDKDLKGYVGSDVHQDTVAMSVADAGRAPGRVLGTMVPDVPDVPDVGEQGKPEQVHEMYEADPTGFWAASGHAGSPRNPQKEVTYASAFSVARAKSSR